MPIWLAYSRRRCKIIAYKIGTSSDCAVELYYEAKSIVGNIERIYTDANSCYSVKFAEIGISNIHYIAPGKSQTHMIESVNSSIRDNLARFNRRSKRFSKCKIMLDDTLFLFFYHKKYKSI